LRVPKIIENCVIIEFDTYPNDDTYENPEAKDCDFYDPLEDHITMGYIGDDICDPAKMTVPALKMIPFFDASGINSVTITDVEHIESP
jgi:hypothetical protein